MSRLSSCSDSEESYTDRRQLLVSVETLHYPISSCKVSHITCTYAL